MVRLRIDKPSFAPYVHSHMIWIAPSEKDAVNDALEKRLWAAANQLWAGAGLKQSEYSEPVLGLIFLRFAEDRFATHRAALEKAAGSSRRGSRLDDPAADHAEASCICPPPPATRTC